MCSQKSVATGPNTLANDCLGIRSKDLPVEINPHASHAEVVAIASADGNVETTAGAHLDRPVGLIVHEGDARAGRRVAEAPWAGDALDVGGVSAFGARSAVSVGCACGE